MKRIIAVTAIVATVAIVSSPAWAQLNLTLQQLRNVRIDRPQVGEQLQFNGNSWQNTSTWLGPMTGALHIKLGVSGVTATSGTLLTLEDDAPAHFSILVPASTASSGFYWGRPGSSTAGGLVYNHVSDLLTIRTAGTNRFFVDSGGNFVPSTEGTSTLGQFSNNRWYGGYFTNELQSPILRGGFAAGGTLSLRSTLDSTKGKVLFGAAGTTAYDEVNDRIGIGTATPAFSLHLVGSETDTNPYNAESVVGSVRNTQSAIDTKAGILFGHNESGGNGYYPTGIFSYRDNGSTTRTAHLGFFIASSDNISDASERWYMEESGHFLAATDNTYDIGASGATRPRSVYAGTSIVTPKVLTSTGTCATGFTAVTTPANYCRANSQQGAVWSNATACTGRTTGASLPADAKFIEIELEWVSLANNAVGLRDNYAVFHSNTGCTAFAGFSRHSSYEHVATTASTSISHGTDHLLIPLAATDTFYATQLNAGGAGNALISQFQVLGYYRE